MGIKDQFQDKAQELKDQAQSRARGVKDEASERASQAKGRPRDPQSDRTRQEAEDRDRFEQDYDA
ncbi:hypothetical protein ACIGO8_29825 [Streptomyces sp. NPDC053493]|uniref:hypothetical protein n=1 Tax=Streptomyces sp. NPDC053493 TaxID=3365705 RepID=UPI0037D5CC20